MGDIKRWLIILVPAVLIVALVGYAVGSHIIPRSVAENFANAASSSAPAAAPADNFADALPEALPPTPAATTSVENTATLVIANDGSPANAQPSNDQGEDAGADEQAQREIARAIHKATLEALHSGEATHWHKDGLQGDIVVSSPQDEGPDQTCRTVTATIGGEDDRDQSGDHVWCQSSDDGGWSPQ